MNETVDGYLVNEIGELEVARLYKTNHPNVFTRNVEAGIFYTTPEFFILGDTFFTVKLYALKKVEDVLTEYIKELQQRKADVLGEIVQIMEKEEEPCN